MIVVAILGVIGAISVRTMDRGRFELRQAARGFAAQVNLARIEAIRRNSSAGVAIDAGSGRYVLYADNPAAGTVGAYDSGEEFRSYQFGSGGLKNVTLSAVAGATNLLFDSRGIPLASVATTVSLVTPSGYSQSIAVSAQGRPVVR